MHDAWTQYSKAPIDILIKLDFLVLQPLIAHTYSNFNKPDYKSDAQTDPAVRTAE